LHSHSGRQREQPALSSRLFLPGSGVVPFRGGMGGWTAIWMLLALLLIWYHTVFLTCLLSCPVSWRVQGSAVANGGGYLLDQERDQEVAYEEERRRRCARNCRAVEVS